MEWLTKSELIYRREHMRNTGPTNCQRQALDELIKWQASHGYPPSLRELAAACGVSAPTMQDRLESLRLQGYVTWIKGKQRTLTVISPALPSTRSQQGVV